MNQRAWEAGMQQIMALNLAAVLMYTRYRLTDISSVSWAWEIQLVFTTRRDYISFLGSHLLASFPYILDIIAMTRNADCRRTDIIFLILRYYILHITAANRL